MRIILLILALLLVAVQGMAQSIHIEWGYTPPSEPEVTGFILYQEGVAVCLTETPTATSMDCEVTLTATVTNFTLTATFSDGTESPHSAPFAFSTGDDDPGGSDEPQEEPPPQPDESPDIESIKKFGDKIGPHGNKRGWVGMQ